MRSFISLVLISALCSAGGQLFAELVGNPVQDFAKVTHLAAGRSLYKWEVDLNHDGKKEVLLEIKQTPEELAQEEKANNWNPETENDHGFSVYIPDGSGNGYIQSKGTDFGTRFQIGTALGINIARCFVGYVTQLKKWGIVSVEFQQAGRRNAAVNTVYAYTLEGDHLKVSDLAKYNPDQGRNEIYEQYLSDAKRTKITLEEMTP